MTFYYHFKDIYDLVEWVCLEEKKSYETWQQSFLQIFELVRENKLFVMNVYRCVHQEQVEKYVKPLMDQLVLEIIGEEIQTMTVREADKEFIAWIYSYIFVGIMLDWIKEDMQGNPQEIVERLGILIKGTIKEALSRFKI